MKNLKKEIRMGFTKESFPESGHVCLIYNSDEQRQKVVSEYLAAGIKEGELVRYIIDETEPKMVRSWLNNCGIDSRKAEENGSFSIVNVENSYYPENRFDPNKMIDNMISRYEMARKAGYSGSRACGEMNWVLKNIPGSDRFIEYEILINDIASSFPHTGMCQYDARLFDGATLVKILEVHPLIIAQGQIVYNPYYSKT